MSRGYVPRRKKGPGTNLLAEAAETSDAWSAFLTVFGIVGGIGIAIVAILTLIYFGGFAASHLGWSDLARVYPAGPRPPEGVIVRGCGGSVGMNTYRGSLVVTFTREGIHVVPGPWEVIGRSHPPILLPWSGVKSATRQEIRFAQHGVIEFQDEDNWTMTLIVPSPAGQDPYTTGWRDFAEG